MRARQEKSTMKFLNMTLMTAAGALMLAAGGASAQTLMKAEIPFAFQVGNAKMAPRTYDVTVNRLSSGTPVIQLDNHLAKGHAIAVANPGHDTRNLDSNGVLTFACALNSCYLRSVTNPETGKTLRVSPPKRTADDMASAKMI